MKRQLLLLSLLLGSGTFVSAQTLNWAKNTQGVGAAFTRSIATDANDNVYIVGNYQGTTDFDPGVGTNDLTAVGADDFYIQKLTSSGNFVWAKSIGDGGNEFAGDIAVTSDGYMYITGTFSNTVDFDPGAAVVNKTSIGITDIFVLKLDLDGNFQSVATFGSTGPDLSGSIVANSSFYAITCFVDSQIDFDPSGSTTNGNQSVFAKFLADGTFDFAHSFGAQFYNLTMDANNNLYPVGYLAGTIDFDPSANDASIGSNGSNDAFVTKYDQTGAFIWAKNFGGTNAEVTQAVDVDNAGNVVITGYYNSLVDFDNSPGTFNLQATGVNDIFVLKLNSNGEFLWVKNIQGSGAKIGNAIETDMNGNIYTTGYFLGSSITVDPAGANLTLTTTGTYSGFVSAFYSDGTTYSAQVLNSGSTTVMVNACMNSQGDFIFGGYHNSEFDADPSTGLSLLAATASSYENTVVSWKYDDLLGLEDESAVTNIVSVYPNPASSALNIITKESLSIQIVNQLGQILSTQNIHVGENNLDISGLSNGVYFIKSQNAPSLKFVKQ